MKWRKCWMLLTLGFALGFLADEMVSEALRLWRR